MADCPCLPGCPFFNDKMAGMSAIANMMKKTYCQTDNHDCARWRVFQALGKGKVPLDLFPNQADRVTAIIAQ